MDEIKTKGTAVREVHDDEADGAEEKDQLSGQASHWRDVFLMMLKELADKEVEEGSPMMQGFMAALDRRCEDHYVLSDLIWSVGMSWEETFDDVFHSIHTSIELRDDSCVEALIPHVVKLAVEDSYILDEIKEQLGLQESVDRVKIKDLLDNVSCEARKIDDQISDLMNEVDALNEQLDIE